MSLEVGDRHLAGGDEGGDAGEQTERDQQAADELDGPRGDHQRRRHLLTAEPAEQLLRAVAGEQQTGDDAQHGVEKRFVLGKNSHGLSSLCPSLTAGSPTLSGESKIGADRLGSGGPRPSGPARPTSTRVRRCEKFCALSVCSSWE